MNKERAMKRYKEEREGWSTASKKIESRLENRAPMTCGLDFFSLCKNRESCSRLESRLPQIYQIPMTSFESANLKFSHFSPSDHAFVSASSLHRPLTLCITSSTAASAPCRLHGTLVA
jgi:hypothetical protein